MRLVALPVIAASVFAASFSPRDVTQGFNAPPPPTAGAGIAPIFVDFGIALDLELWLGARY